MTRFRANGLRVLFLLSLAMIVIFFFAFTWDSPTVWKARRAVKSVFHRQS